VAEHWYRRKYNREPPHLDALYTGDEPLTDENRAELKQMQDEEHERKAIALLEEAEAGRERALLEKQEQDKLRPVAAVVVAVERDIEKEREEHQTRSLEMWNQIVSKSMDGEHIIHI
jgi:hypothetical protein